MLRFPKLVLLFILAVFNLFCIAAAKTVSIGSIKGYETNDSLPQRARTATLNATINPIIINVCQDDPEPVLTFTGSGGSSPYTFIYKINGGDDLSIHTTSGNDDATIVVPTDVEGIYTYSLVSVSDPFNSPQSQTGTSTVTVAQKPDATLNSSGDLVYFNGYSTFTTCSSSSAEVTFTNSSTTISTNLGYEISWGDGSPDFSGASWNILTHTYAVGFWDLTYRITGQNGCLVTEIYKIFVGSNPAVSLGSPGNTNICANESLTFPITGTESNPQGTTYTVTFNDGSAPQIFNHPPPVEVTHTFILSSCGTTSFNGPVTFPNSFSVGILASNPCGQSAVSVVPIYVSKQPVASFISPDNTVCINTPVCIDNTSTGASLASAAGCDAGYKIIWTILPSTGVTLNSGSLGSDFGSANQNIWITGTDIICPVFSIPGTYTITIKVANRCGIALSTKTICVEPPLVPQFTLNTNAGCTPLSVSATNTTNLDNICNSPVYSWEVSYVASNCGTSPAYTFTNGTSTSASPSFQFTNPGTYNLKLLVTNSCGTNSVTQTITVKNPPTVSITAITTLCQTFPVTVITPTATVVNCGASPLSYQWSFPGGDPATSAVLNPGPINYSTPGTYSVALTVTNECGLTAVTGNTFTINPTPTVNDIANQTKCMDQLSDAIVFQGSVPGTVYNWTNNNTTFGLAAFGTGDINPFILTNTGIVLLTATVTVTPVIVATGCSGAPKTFQISVHPKPIVSIISNKRLCNNEAFVGVNLSSPVVLTTFTWVNSNINIGLVATGSGNIPGFTAINIGTTPEIATVTVTPWNVLGCPGTAKIFFITVNPTPASLVLTDKEFCNGVVTSPIIFNNAVAGTTYTWTNSNTSIGLAGTGTGNVPSFTPVNNGTGPITSTITVTPSANGCPGLSQTFTITVNPSPVITFSPGNQSLCSGDNSVLVTLSCATTGVTFNWTAVAPAGITGVVTSGTSTIPVQTLLNSTNVALNVIYSATALVNGSVSCAGAVFNYTITVKPKPLVSADILSTICSGDVFTVTPVNGFGNIIPVGTTYTWDIPVINPPGALTGSGAQSTSQSSISQTLTNTTLTAASATYSVTPASTNGCTGSPFNVIVTVNPKPTVQFPEPDQILCSGKTSLPVTLSSVTTGNVTFNWVASIPSGITGAVAAGTNVIPAQTLINSTANPLTVTYSATATLNNGISCPGIPSDYTITVNPLVNTSSIVSNYGGYNISVTGGNDGWINLTVTGGSGVYSYSWSGPNGFTASTQDISTLLTGTYTLSLGDGMCDPVILNFNLTEPIEILIQEDLSSHVNVLCNGDFSGVIRIDIIQPSLAPYDYVLTRQSGVVVESVQNISSIQYSFTGLSAGTYNVTVTDATGNFKTISGIIITEPAIINVSINAQLNVTCPGGNNGSATVTASGGTGVLNYSWNTLPVQTTPTAAGLAAGTYNATVTDANGCQAVVPVIIVEPNDIVISISSQTNIGCFGESTGSATLTASGGTGTLSYSWDTNPVQITPTVTGLPAGNYLVTITDATGCSKDQLVTITQPAALLSSSIMTSTDISCYGLNDGTATVLATGGTIPYSYSWNTVPVQNSATAVGLTTGNYTVTITDVNGCTSFSSVSITEPAQITAAITAQTNVSCWGGNSGSATVAANGGTGAFSYSWNTIPVQTSATANGLTAGTYIATVIDANGCRATAPVTILEPTEMVVSIISQTNVLCFGDNTGSATVIANGGTGMLSYSWNTIPVQTTPTVNGLPVGTYQITVTDSFGCQKVEVVTITQPAAVLSSIITDSNMVSCFEGNDGSATITATGGTSPYSYSWNTVPVQNTATAAGLSAGNYIVTITDVSGCQSTSSIDILEPTKITAFVSALSNINCFGSTGSATVTASGGTGAFSYSWNTNPVQTTQTATSLASGTYTVTVTDDNGCTITEPVSITDPNGIVSSISSQTNVGCYGESTGSATVTASGGTGTLNYLWNTNPVQTTETATVLAAGTYTVTVTDANGCFVTDQITITEPTEIIPSLASQVNVSCFGESTGSATVNTVGGVGVINYSWNTNPVQTTQTATGLAAGNYMATATDANGCSGLLPVTITEPTEIITSITSQTNVSCFGESTGSATVTASGGTGVLSYSWNTIPVQTTQTVSGLIAGNYQVTVFDSSGCSKVQIVTITQSTNSFTSSIIASNAVSCFGESDGNATVTATGGALPYSYSWNCVPEQTTPAATGLKAGNYIVAIRDANDCVSNSSVIITEPTPISASITTQTNVSCFGGTTGSAMVTANGGTGTLNYSWNTTPVQAAATATGLAAGIYTVTVSDENSCTVIVPVIITEPNEIIASITSQTDILCFGESTGSATITASGGTGVLGYSWNTIPAQNAPMATGLAAGIYQVTVTDASFCSKVQIVTLTQPVASLISSIISFNNVSCFGGNNGTASVLATGGTSPYSYSWNCVPEQTTTSATDLHAGNYVVSVTDVNGCVSSSSILIAEPTQILASITGQSNVTCPGSNTGSATVTASGGVGSLRYLWNTMPIQTTPTAFGLVAGTYAVTVTDANNCNVLVPVTISEPTTIITSISSQTNVLCFGEKTGSATVSASGGTGTLSYLWNTIPAQITPVATGLNAGTYQVTVADINACFKVQEVTITQPADIVISTDNKKDVTCAGSSNGEIHISVTGGTGAYRYSWTKNNVSFATTEDLSNIGPGIYVVLISDANGCGPKSASFAITEPPVLVVSLVSKTNVICNGEATGAITVRVTGGTPIEVSPGIFDYGYAWTGLYGYTNTGQNLTNIPAGTYQLTVTDFLGCSNVLSVIISQPSELVVSLITTSITCYGSNNASIALSISGGVSPYQIRWSNLGSGMLQQDLSAGNYSVTVIDAIGCQKVVGVTIPEAPVFTMNPIVKNVSCFGAKDGSINLNFSGGTPPVSLVWSDSSVAGTTRNNLGPGTYSVTIHDGTLCSLSQIFVILEPQLLVLTANITNAFNCNTANSGTINLIVAGGTPPVNYAWSNGANTKDLTDMPAGNYMVTVTDSVGCIQTAQYVIQRQSPLAIAVATTIDFNCTSKMVTEICTAQITGGVSPYTLTWTGGGKVSGTYNQIMEASQNGMVILTVTDAIGCSATYAFNVEIPANGISSSLNDCTNHSFQFNTITINPQSIVSYSWDFGDGTNSTIRNPKHSYVTFGIYQVRLTVTNASCTYSYNETIVVEAPPVLSLAPEPKFCKGDSILVFVSGAHTYQWFDGSVGDSIWIKQAGDFIVTGTSKTGCSSTLSFTASYYELLSYTIQTDKNEVSSDEPTLHVWSETTSSTQYFWDFGDGEVSQGNDLNHTYAVAKEGYYDINLKVINPNGCLELATKRIWIVNSSLPNTLTPNGDGINDVFMKDWHIQVFNRNGILMYDGIDGWDGTYKGEKVTNDTYFFVLYFIAESGTKTRTGYITVIR